MSRRWTINIDYTSSDSESSRHHPENFLDIEWENLDRAKEALKRIKAFHESEKRRWGDETTPKPTPIADLPGYSKQFGSITMTMQLDDGTEQQVRTFWRGWGNSLHKAEIVVVPPDQDPDMIFEPNSW